jgi:hypothetical protein
MIFSHPAFLYYYIGVLVTLFCIWYYCPRGQSRNPNELYLAVVGPVVWPLLVLKFLLDRVLDRIQYQRDLKFHAWLEENLERLNVGYHKYCTYSEVLKRDFLSWCKMCYNDEQDAKAFNTKQ